MSFVTPAADAIDSAVKAVSVKWTVHEDNAIDERFHL